MAKEMEDLMRKHARRTPGSITLYQERGTYVGYVKVAPEYMKMRTAPQAFCPVAADGATSRQPQGAPASGASGASSSGSRAPGGTRRPQWA